jgi:hypothetical protein
LSAQRLRWVYHHLYYSMLKNYFIYSAFLLGTPKTSVIKTETYSVDDNTGIISQESVGDKN